MEMTPRNEKNKAIIEWLHTIKHLDPKLQEIMDDTEYQRFKEDGDPICFVENSGDLFIGTVWCDGWASSFNEIYEFASKHTRKHARFFVEDVEETWADWSEVNWEREDN